MAKRLGLNIGIGDYSSYYVPSGEVAPPPAHNELGTPVGYATIDFSTYPSTTLGSPWVFVSGLSGLVGLATVSGGSMSNNVSDGNNRGGLLCVGSPNPNFTIYTNAYYSSSYNSNWFIYFRVKDSGNYFRLAINTSKTSSSAEPNISCQIFRFIDGQATIVQSYYVMGRLNDYPTQINFYDTGSSVHAEVCDYSSSYSNNTLNTPTLNTTMLSEEVNCGFAITRSAKISKIVISE